MSLSWRALPCDRGVARLKGQARSYDLQMLLRQAGELSVVQRSRHAFAHMVCGCVMLRANK